MCAGKAPLHGLERSQSIESEMKSERRSEVAVVRIYLICVIVGMCLPSVQHMSLFSGVRQQ